MPLKSVNMGNAHWVQRVRTARYAFEKLNIFNQGPHVQKQNISWIGHNCLNGLVLQTNSSTLDPFYFGRRFSI